MATWLANQSSAHAPSAITIPGGKWRNFMLQQWDRYKRYVANVASPCCHYWNHFRFHTSLGFGPASHGVRKLVNSTLSVVIIASFFLSPPTRSSIATQSEIYFLIETTREASREKEKSTLFPSAFELFSISGPLFALRVTVFITVSDMIEKKDLCRKWKYTGF